MHAHGHKHLTPAVKHQADPLPRPSSSLSGASTHPPALPNLSPLPTLLGPSATTARAGLTRRWTRRLSRRSGTAFQAVNCWGGGSSMDDGKQRKREEGSRAAGRRRVSRKIERFLIYVVSVTSRNLPQHRIVEYTAVTTRVIALVIKAAPLRVSSTILRVHSRPPIRPFWGLQLLGTILF